MSSLLVKPAPRSRYPSLEEIRAERDRRARHRSPAAFVRDCFHWAPGQGPTLYQMEILEEVPARKRIAVRGPHGLGKTTISAWLLLWFALTRDGTDWKAPTTASAWRQLEKFLWPEVRKWARILDWSKLGRGPMDPKTELLTHALKLSTGEAFAVASDQPDLIEGAHGDSILYVFDEAKAIPGDIFDAAEGAFSGAGTDTPGEAYAVAISTPGEPVGRFYDIHARKPGYEDWWVRHVTLDEAIAAGRISRDWVDQRRRQWGENSAVYQNRVLGEFASSESDGVIPLAWVEMANDRWREWSEAGGVLPDRMDAVGCDIARSGEDKTVLALRYGRIISELRRTSREDTMTTTGRIKGLLTAQGGRAVVDVIGIGAGVVDRLREMRLQVEAFNASERSDEKDRSGELGFMNKRSAGWWGMREMLDPANGDTVALPPDDLLTGDLTAPKWRVMSGGRIQVEDKDAIHSRIGRSTDDGDAVIMACNEGNGASLPFGWMGDPRAKPRA